MDLDVASLAFIDWQAEGESAKILHHGPDEVPTLEARH
jgi:hypothetical protein